MKRIKEEQRVVEQMIRLYCRKKEGNNELCPGCQELLQYATARLERCKFGENKPTCKKCPIHCYRPQMKERMCKVMRWAKNDFVSPGSCHQACHKRIVTIRK